MRGRLALLVISLVLPLSVLAGALAWQSYLSERRALEQQLRSISRAVTLLVDGHVQEKLARVGALASAESLGRGDLVAFDQRARALVPLEQGWIVLTDAAGQQLINTHRPAGTSPLPRSSASAEIAAAIRAHKMYVSGVEIGPVRSAPVLFVGLPVLEGGTLRYTINFVFEPAEISELLTVDRVPEAWTAVVIDREGRILARNRDAQGYVGRPARSDLIENSRSLVEGFMRGRTYDNLEVLTSYQRSSLSGWTVAIGAPRDSLFASARRSLALGAALSLGVILFAVAMAAWVGRGLVRGLDQVVADTEALASGWELGTVQTGFIETDRIAKALRATGSKLKAREDELRQMAGELETRVQKRTEELQRAYVQIEDFAKVASHDLKEPLRVISNFAGILKSDYSSHLDDDGRRLLERIGVAALRLQHLIQDILAYSQAGLPRVSVPVDLDAVLKDVTTDLEMRLRETRGRIESSNLGTVAGDPAQMHQVLSNLIGNALKFRKPDVPPVIQVRTEQRGSEVVLVVEDNGIGFEAQYAERIFRPFQRLHGRSAYEGTGLGLSIVRRIAERHGGRVSASSVVGEGSRFEVSLPRDG